MLPVVRFLIDFGYVGYLMALYKCAKKKFYCNLFEVHVQKGEGGREGLLSIAAGLYDAALQPAGTAAVQGGRYKVKWSFSQAHRLTVTVCCDL